MKIKRRDLLKGMAGGLALAALDAPGESRAAHGGLSPEAVGILYDSTLCVGCNACMAACKRANKMPVESDSPEQFQDNPVDLSSKTLNIIKKYSHGTAAVKDQAENGYAFIKRQCLHCIEASCATACPVAALVKDPVTGIVTYDKDRCIGCRYCQVACPFHVPKFEWDKAYSKIVKCQLCSHAIPKGKFAACCSHCPTGASLYGNVTELRAEAQRRMQMVAGETYDFPVRRLGSGLTQSHVAANYVKHIYGLEELGGTQVMYLSAVPFEKFGLDDFPRDSYATTAANMQSAIYKGMVMPVVGLAALYCVIRRNKLAEDAEIAAREKSEGGEHHA